MRIYINDPKNKSLKQHLSRFLNHNDVSQTQLYDAEDWCIKAQLGITPENLDSIISDTADELFSQVPNYFIFNNHGTIQLILYSILSPTIAESFAKCFSNKASLRLEYMDYNLDPWSEELSEDVSWMKEYFSYYTNSVFWFF